MVLHHAGKCMVHHHIAPALLGKVALAGRFDTNNVFEQNCERHSHG